MEQNTKRTVAEVLIAATGLVLGVAAAAAFNLAGVIWTPSGLDVAYYWEPTESGITTAFGCVLLLGWLISLIFLVATGWGTPQRGRHAHWVGILAALISLVLVGSALAYALIVLPAQYEWVLH